MVVRLRHFGSKRFGIQQEKGWFAAGRVAAQIAPVLECGQLRPVE
jgi:hypothetical protein